jgi:hypothetical protein
MLFLNFNQAASGELDRQKLPTDYALACRFLHCSIIDRTRTLDTGFPYDVIDPIPAPVTEGPSFAELCDARGKEIVEEALTTGRRIDVLWSGGIDSTTALISVIKATNEGRCTDCVRILLSMNSVLEYPRFFLDQINSQMPIRAVNHPISHALDPGALTVTGEHGDQLFGSHLLESYVRRGLAGVDYREILPLVMLERLRSPRSVQRMRRYLQSAIDVAPVPIHSLFDCMWWLNFSLKWQEVILRLTVFRGDQAKPVYQSLRHFFRSDPFQSWALATTPGLPVPVWSRYKDVAKQYIYGFTGDQTYFKLKEKEDSLRNVMAPPVNGERCRVFMKEDFRPVVRVIEPPAERSLRTALQSVRNWASLSSGPNI